MALAVRNQRKAKCMRMYVDSSINGIFIIHTVIFRLWAEDLQARAERVISSVVRLGGNYGCLTP
jgi:hypothetical protein